MMNQKTTSVDLSTVLAKLMEVISKDLNCIKIGTIEKFTKENQTADVQVTIKKFIEETAQGEKIYRQIPLLLEVPVVIISGGDSYLQMPITVGDSCLLLFSDDDIDNWVTSNGNTPDTNKKHDISDAICLVGLRNLSNPIEGFDNTKIKLQFSSDVFIEMDSSGSSIKGNLDVDGQVSATTVKPANGVTGPAGPTNTITFQDGIAISIA